MKNNKSEIIITICCLIFFLILFSFVINDFKKENIEYNKNISNIEQMYEETNTPIEIKLIPDKYWVYYWINRFGIEKRKIYENTVGESLIQMTEDGWPKKEIYIRYGYCKNKYLEDIINHEIYHILSKKNMNEEREEDKNFTCR